MSVDDIRRAIELEAIRLQQEGENVKWPYHHQEKGKPAKNLLSIPIVDPWDATQRVESNFQGSLEPYHRIVVQQICLAVGWWTVVTMYGVLKSIVVKKTHQKVQTGGLRLSNYEKDDKSSYTHIDSVHVLDLKFLDVGEDIVHSFTPFQVELSLSRSWSTP